MHESFQGLEAEDSVSSAFAEQQDMFIVTRNFRCSQPLRKMVIVTILLTRTLSGTSQILVCVSLTRSLLHDVPHVSVDLVFDEIPQIIRDLSRVLLQRNVRNF